MKHRRIKLLPLLAGLALSISAANAASWTVYTDQNTFNAAISGSTYTTNFSFSPGPLGSPFTISGNGLSVSAIPTDTNYTLYGYTNGLSVSSEGYDLLYTNFSTGAVAFGGRFFNLNTEGAFVSGNLTMSVTFADLGTASFTNVAAPSLTNFWGLVASTNITSFSLTGIAGVPTSGQITLGAVPEASTTALLAMSLAVLAIASRWRVKRRH